jgi:hypothetical protein
LPRRLAGGDGRRRRLIMSNGRWMVLAVFVCLVGSAGVAACGDDDGGGDDWRALGISAANEGCEKAYECLSAAELTALRAIEPQIGNTVDECKANFRAEVMAEDAPCNPGETYNASAATQCVSEWTAMSCDQLRASPDGPVICSQVCTGGS